MMKLILIIVLNKRKKIVNIAFKSQKTRLFYNNFFYKLITLHKTTHNIISPLKIYYIF